MSLHEAKDIAFDLVIGCSIAHTFFPPWDAEPFKPFPRFQKYYRLLIYVIGYVGINFRSTVYKSISIENPNGKNAGGQAALPSDATQEATNL